MIKKIVYSLLSVGVPTSIIVPIVLAGKNKDTIIAKGSSSVLPFAQEVAKHYDKAEININGGGSGTAIDAIINNESNISHLSRTPKQSELNKLGNINVNTVTIGKDAIALILKAPKGVELKNTVTASIQNIRNLFTTKDKKVNEIFEGKDINVDSSITTISRSNPNASGTAEIFMKGLSVASKTNSKDLNGVDETSGESNGESFKTLKGQRGWATTYISLGIAELLLKDNPNMALVNIYNDTNHNNKQDKAEKLNIPSIINVNNKIYNWVRPLNMMYKVDENNQKEKEWISFVLTNGQEYLKNVGYIKLSVAEQQKELVSIKNNQIDSNKDYTKHGIQVRVGF